MTKARWLAAALWLVALPALPASEHYRVDLIVFADASARATAPAAPSLPGTGSDDATAGGGDDAAGVAPAAGNDTENAPPVSADEAATLSREGVRMLPDGDFGLQGQWDHLKHSSRYHPVAHLSWIQYSAPERGGPTVRFHVSDHVIGGIDGGFTLNGGYLLHLGAHMAAGSSDPSGSPNRLDEVRRLRLDELHYLDSPHLGVLVRVSRAEPAAP